MSNSAFKFKQFTINQDKCAMKVGTDGVLLGAWAPADSVQNILDIGTGTGLIALQLAQRNPNAMITAIEIDPSAADQAKSNVLNSPWFDRIEVICTDLKKYQPEKMFDFIISNPPYFINALKCPDKQRCTARHTEDLSFNSLFRHATQLLTQEGALCIIIPSEAESIVQEIAWNYKLHPVRYVQVFTKPGKPYRRVLLAFGFQYVECIKEKLYIEMEHNDYTPEYTNLTKDFYLKM